MNLEVEGDLQLFKLRIGERLRELRIKSGFTQSQIAKVLNIDRSTYSYYEIGKTTPDVSTLMALAKIFNISIDNLLADEIPHRSLAQKKPAANYLFSKKNTSHIYELSGTEKELVGLFRVCPRKQQAAILDHLRKVNAQQQEPSAPKTPK